MTNSRVQEALKTLTEEGYVWKVWNIEDVQNRIAEMRGEDDFAFEGIPAEEDEAIARGALSSYYFYNLAGCTEQDWANIDNAIYEALEG